MYRRVNRPALYLLIFVFLIIEETVISFFSIKNILPDILVMFVVFSGLFFGVSVGVETGLACGVIRDLLEIGVFGRNILFFGVLGLVTGFLSDRVYKNNALVQAGITFGAVFFVSKFNVYASLYSSIVAPAFFLLARTLFRIRDEF